MSDTSEPGPPTWPAGPPAPPAPPRFTPGDTERSEVAGEALRRRQLRAALIHGSSRTWRQHPRVWPAVVAGVVVVAVVLATLAVIGAYDETSETRPGTTGKSSTWCTCPVSTREPIRAV